MDPNIKAKSTTKKLSFYPLPRYLTYLSWKQEVFQKYQVFVLLVLQLNVGITLCSGNLNSSIGTINLRACKLYREHQNVFVISFLTPTFRIPVQLLPTLYRGEENPSSFHNMQTFSPHSILRPGVQQLYLLLCEEHLFKYSEFSFTSILWKLQP